MTPRGGVLLRGQISPLCHPRLRLCQPAQLQPVYAQREQHKETSPTGKENRSLAACQAWNLPSGMEHDEALMRGSPQRLRNLSCGGGSCPFDQQHVAQRVEQGPSWKAVCSCQEDASSLPTSHQPGSQPSNIPSAPSRMSKNDQALPPSPPVAPPG